MALSKYPSLFRVNSRIWLTELSHSLRRAATLEDIPDAALDRLAETGVDWVGTIGTAATSNRTDSIWMCLPGNAMPFL